MIILAINTKKKLINIVKHSDVHIHIPNKGDSIWFEGKKYKVISRYFQYYSDNTLEIVNIYVRPIKWWDYFKCL